MRDIEFSLIFQFGNLFWRVIFYQPNLVMIWKQLQRDNPSRNGIGYVTHIDENLLPAETAEFLRQLFPADSYEVRLVDASDEGNLPKLDLSIT